jgi:hypothetical protein
LGRKEGTKEGKKERKTELKFRLENLVHSPTVRSGDLKGLLFRGISGYDIAVDFSPC